MIREWIIILVCFLCVFCAVSAFKYGMHRKLLSTLSDVTKKQQPLHLDTTRPVNASNDGMLNINRPATKNRDDVRHAATDDETRRIKQPTLQELPTGLRDMLKLEPNPEMQDGNRGEDSESVSASVSASVSENGPEATMTNSSRSFPALARKTRVPQSSISSQYLNSFQVSAPSSDLVDYVSERFTKSDAEIDSPALEDASEQSPSNLDRRRGPRSNSRMEESNESSTTSPVDFRSVSLYNKPGQLEPDMSADANFEVDSRKADRMSVRDDESTANHKVDLRKNERNDDEATGNPKACMTEHNSHVQNFSTDESIGNHLVYEKDNTTKATTATTKDLTSTHSAPQSTALSSSADESVDHRRVYEKDNAASARSHSAPHSTAVDDSVGNHRVYEKDNSTTARSHSAPVDLPVVFIRSELKDRMLRVLSSDAIETFNQTDDDDFLHATIDRENQLFRFNGVVFNWIPSECKQSQPIFFLSGGIHVTHVGSSILLKQAEEVHEVTIDRTYKSYLVCIWSYGSNYHMSVLGQHRTAGWDAAWYGITVRQQPLWSQPVQTTLHIHRSIHGLVWYQSNATEASVPDERYLQSIATRRFQ